MNNMPDGDLFVKMKFLYSSFTKAEKRIADIILTDYENVCNYSMADFSQAADCSEASVMRFCRKIGMHAPNSVCDARESIEVAKEWLAQHPDAVDTIYFVDARDDYFNCFGTEI